MWPEEVSFVRLHIPAWLLLLVRLMVLPSAVLCAAPEAARAGPGGEEKEERRKKGFKYVYAVEKGDTLDEIAARFEVSVKQLCKWNPKSTKDPKRLTVGTKLSIYAKVPVRNKRRSTYVVRRGDNLRRIARKLNVSEEQLRSLNGLRGHIIHPGDKLTYLLPGPEKESESIGRSYDGRLVNGEKLPKGPGYSYGSRPNVYGTNETITLLIQCFGEQIRKYPDGPLIVVGNLSQRNGGEFGPHASHQSGRDVDIGYFHKKKYQPVTQLIHTTPKTLDPRKTWNLLQCFLDSGQVSYVFINYELQKALYEHLEQRRFKKAYIDRLFQYPRKSGGGGIIQHSDGHDDHIHIRFVCPKGDKRCRD